MAWLIGPAWLWLTDWAELSLISTSQLAELAKLTKLTSPVLICNHQDFHSLKGQSNPPNIRQHARLYQSQRGTLTISSNMPSYTGHRQVPSQYQTTCQAAPIPDRYPNNISQYVIMLYQPDRYPHIISQHVIKLYQPQTGTLTLSANMPSSCPSHRQVPIIERYSHNIIQHAKLYQL